MTYLSRKQVGQLIRPINPNRVGKRDGMSHLEAYDVRAMLTRVFGFGRWSGEVLSVDMLYEQATKTKAGNEAFAVGYRCTYRLTVFAPDGTELARYTEAATGDGVMPVSKRADAHDFAIKTAESQAMKRCAINLGDNFGLSLYRKGSLDALVGYVLGPEPARYTDAGPEWADEKPGAGEKHEDATAHITSPLPPEDVPVVAPEPSAPGPPEGSAPVQENPAKEKRQQVAAEVAEKALVDDLRHRALNIPEDEQRPKAYLTKLLMEASRAGLQNSLVPDRDDNYVSFAALVQAEVAVAAVRERAS